MNQKVLYIASYENVRFKGGIYTVAQHILQNKEQLMEQGIELIPLSACQRKRDISKVGKFSVENILNLFYVLKKSLRIIKSEEVSMVYINTSNDLAFFKDVLICAIIRIITPSKTLLHIHYSGLDNILPRNKILKYWSIFLTNKFVDSLVFLNQSTAVDFINFGYTGSTYVLPNFHLSESKERTVEEKRESINLLYLGTIDRRKGFDVTIRLLNELGATEAILHVAGSWKCENFKEVMLREIEKLGLQNSIKFYGFLEQEDKFSLIKKMDVLVLLSKAEGMSMALLEALDWGLAVIASDIVANREVLQGAGNQLFHLNDFKGMKEQIMGYANDPGTLIKSKDANLLLSKKYDFSNHFTTFKDILRAECL